MKKIRFLKFFCNCCSIDNNYRTSLHPFINKLRFTFNQEELIFVHGYSLMRFK